MCPMRSKTKSSIVIGFSSKVIRMLMMYNKNSSVVRQKQNSTAFDKKRECEFRKGKLFIVSFFQKFYHERGRFEK